MARIRIPFWLLLATLAVVATKVRAGELEAIYGEDNRLEIDDPAVPARIREYAHATALILPRTRIYDVSGSTSYRRLAGRTLGDKLNLCPKERFVSQPAPGYCTGFLVGPDLLATAGHCIASSTDCDNAAFVFDFTEAHGLTDPTLVPTRNIYYCHYLEVPSKVDPVTGVDYALVRLDRPAVGRQPLPLRPSGILQVGEPLTIIGYPDGLPLKIAGDGFVRSSTEPGFFVTNNDTFTGNSGSPVVNTQTGLVEGVVVRGDNDYDRTPSGCMTVRHCSMDGCRGEDATRVAEFRDLVPPTGKPLIAEDVTTMGELSGNGNGRPEPGESVRIAVKVKNNGLETITDARLGLVSLTKGVTVAGTTRVRNLAPGNETTLVGFSLELAPTLACAATVELEVQGTLDGVSKTTEGRLELGRTKPQEYAYAGAPVAIPDSSEQGVTIDSPSIDAPGGRSVLVKVDIAHPNTDQIRVVLTAPDGTSVVLHNYGLAPAGGLLGSPDGRLAGTYGESLEPYESLLPFSEVGTSGPWHLTVADTSPGLTGEVRGFSVIVLDRACEGR